MYEVTITFPDRASTEMMSKDELDNMFLEAFSEEMAKKILDEVQSLGQATFRPLGDDDIKVVVKLSKSS
jgi:heat shock protein HslJ